VAGFPRRTAGALLLAAFVLCFRLGAPPLADPDEGRNAEVAREMATSGWSLVPTLDGIDYLDKPPLYFAIVAASLRALGHTETAARLPSALFAFATLLALALYLRRHAPDREVALAIVVTVTAPLFFAFARIVIFDSTLGFFVVASILAAAASEEEERAGRAREAGRWHLASAAACGVATLIKGPVGFVVPALVVTAYRRLERRRLELRFLVRPAGIALFLLLVLPWFLGTVAVRPDFLRYGLVEETFLRMTTGAFRRNEPIWFYIPVAVGGLLAWSLLLPGFARAGWRERARWRPSDRLFVAWAAAVFLFFTLSKSKQPAYVLTGIVALAALVARGLERALDAPRGRGGRALRHASAAWAVLALLLAGATWIASHPGLVSGVPAPRPGSIAAAVDAGVGSLTLPLVVIAALAALGAGGRRPRIAITALALLVPSLPLFGGELFERYFSFRSARELAAALPTGDGVDLACLGCFPPSLLFYRGRPLTVVELRDPPITLTSNYVVSRIAATGTWPERIVPLQALGQRIERRSGALGILATAAHRPELEVLRARYGGALSAPAPGWGLLLLPAPSD